MLAPAQFTALPAGEIDLALLRPPVPQSGLFVETVRRDRLLVALPADHPLAGRHDLWCGSCTTRTSSHTPDRAVR